MKYVVVTGGVISGVGKGIIASSTGVLLRSLGLSVGAIKIDPYLNIDAGTMSPYDHGECFVLNDGGEVDLDLGNYERFLDVTLTSDNNITTGKIYQHVIEKERRGDYLGKTVQVVPHVTDAIQDWIERVARVPLKEDEGTGSEPDICVIELGGTVGDIESAPFVEALRQFQFRVGHQNFFLIHVSLVPSIGGVQEQKSKPTQHSVQALRALGLSPDVLCCRSLRPLESGVKEKLALFCHVPSEKVLSVYDCQSVYHVPMLLRQQGMFEHLSQRLALPSLQLSEQREKAGVEYYAKWCELAQRLYSSSTPSDTDLLGKEEPVLIGIVGKYTHLHECYLSIIKALNHAEMNAGIRMKIVWIEASDLEGCHLEDVSGGECNGGVGYGSNGSEAEAEASATKGGSSEASETLTSGTKKEEDAWAKMRSLDGIIIPGGFGARGTEGKIMACRFGRERKIPLLGICLGFQLSVVEHCRSLLGMKDANSVEFDQGTKEKVVIFMPEIEKNKMGGNMRLGARLTKFSDRESKSWKLYQEWNKLLQSDNGSDMVLERHRHRYEINPEIVDEISTNGLRFVGRDESGERMEILERSDHPYYVACQYHPEFLSRPLHPSPLFVGLLRAAKDERERNK